MTGCSNYNEQNYVCLCKLPCFNIAPHPPRENYKEHWSKKLYLYIVIWDPLSPFKPQLLVPVVELYGDSVAFKIFPLHIEDNPIQTG